MYKIIILFVSLIICSDCSSSGTAKTNEDFSNDILNKIKQWNYMSNDTVFVPDTTINNLLFLNNDMSIINNIGDTKDLMVNEKDYFPYVYFVNKNGNQYIKMTIFAGGSLNSFDIFEIGYVTPFLKNEILNKSHFENFSSESGIHLGMNELELKRIKGNNFTKTQSNGMNVLNYQISEGENFDGENFTSKFLERNGIGYTAFYFFKNDKLVKFSYGFEYP
jgi:hypothetical protein